MNLKDVQLLVTDVDGVMTDDAFIYAEDGHKRLRFNNADGVGILRLRELCGVETWFLTQESNPDIDRRAEALGCLLLIGGLHKWNWLLDELDRKHILPRKIAYIGNDVNDVETLANVGYAFTPAYSVIAPDPGYIVETQWRPLRHPGGQGCVREVCEMIIKAKGQ